MQTCVHTVGFCLHGVRLWLAAPKFLILLFQEPPRRTRLTLPPLPVKLLFSKKMTAFHGIYFFILKG